MEDSASVADNGCYWERSCNRLLVLSGFGVWYSGWVRAAVMLRTASKCEAEPKLWRLQQNLEAGV